ncbi:hypothetical protein TELCIR_13279 [Teladorsagia circumcincta]|uniref:HEAT repeat protein n=1 Tax=Teladorsagia circumcincta TaxID=45464 RepID=A0A2G9U4I6_TELCI|nr:hypothetical protein TELCIR_13279 [Teladorsagia circumcincta]
MGNSLVRLFERMIFDEESAVQTVHRLFIVVCRSFDDQSFEQILKPLVELLSCESSVKVQYLPFCVDLVEQATRRLTPQIEAGLLAAFRIVRLSAKSMTDHQLMNYLEDYIVDKVIVQVLQLVLNANSSFFDDRSRVIVGAGAVSLLYNISMRIGLENTRMYARKPFELMFEAFGKLYEADEQLRISAKKLKSNDTVASIPLWFVSSVIDRFATSWGVPLLSSFCSDPAFLVPFVSSQGESLFSIWL